MSFNKDFHKKGFFKINNLISKKKLNTINKEIISFANQFSKKINKNEFKRNIKTTNDFSDFCIKLEKYNPKYFFHFVTLVSKLNSILDLTNFICKKKLTKISSEILNENQKNLLTSYPPAFLVNLPRNRRVLYHWHTAKNAYPKRASYINFWVPLFVNKKKDNGSLKIAEKSHFNESYPYKEFKDIKRYGKNALTQMLISNKYINKFKIQTLRCETGSLYGMHKNLIHSSTLNKSKNCSYVLIFKIWTIAKDLTLSSNIQQKNNADEASGEDIVSI